jgi:fructose-bisphosphate aldolase class I
MISQTAQKLLATYKGILAADESTPSITKRFEKLGLVSTPELNKKYREMLFTTPDIEKYISGVILFDETIKQGLGEILKEKGILVGIKVDEGLTKFKDTDQKITKGLEGLESRLEEYKKLGATFTKWRGVVNITDLYPTDEFLDQMLEDMVKYAKIVQAAGLTPIVEPEVLYDGNHTNTRCEEVTTKVLKKLFEIINSENIDISNLILKSSMVMPGKDSGVVVMPLEVSNSTLRTFQNSVPENLPGIVFLSGGQTTDQSIFNLNEINKLNKERKFGDWELSFSFGRALQQDAMAAWNGKDENAVDAQKIFGEVLVKTSKARMGEL